MDMNIENRAYEFPVEKRPLYFPIRDKYGNVTYDEVSFGRTKTMGVIRTDTNKPLGVCSSRYQIINHAEVKQYTDDLISSLNYKVSSQKLELPNNGATMLYFNILNNDMSEINGTKLKVTLMGKNSYNGMENASIECLFVNEENTIFGFGMNKETKLSNKKLVSHKGKVVEKTQEEFGQLVDFIPKVIANTITLWNAWDKQTVTKSRVMLICKALGAGFAKYMKDNGKFDSITRFEFYKMFCKYNMNLGTIGKHYKSQKSTIGKMNNLFLMDEMYLNDSKFADKVIEKLKKFEEYDVDEYPVVKRVKSSRTFTAIKNGTLSDDYSVANPEPVEEFEQIKEETENPIIVEEETSVEEEEKDDLLKGW